jgi:hypothetical protein
MSGRLNEFSRQKIDASGNEPDLKVAVRQMVCNYSSVRGWTDPLYSLISRLQNAALKQDDPLELTEKAISIETRAKLKNLYADPDPGRWDWDPGEWDWELLLRDAQEDVDAGYVAIIPVKNGRRFEYKIKPHFSHNEWAIIFVAHGFDFPTILVKHGFNFPTILVKGSLEEAKRTLDRLLRVPTPEILSY